MKQTSLQKKESKSALKIEDWLLVERQTLSLVWRVRDEEKKSNHIRTSTLRATTPTSTPSSTTRAATPSAPGPTTRRAVSLTSGQTEKWPSTPRSRSSSASTPSTSPFPAEFYLPDITTTPSTSGTRWSATASPCFTATKIGCPGVEVKNISSLTLGQNKLECFSLSGSRLMPRHFALHPPHLKIRAKCNNWQIDIMTINDIMQGAVGYTQYVIFILKVTASHKQRELFSILQTRLIKHTRYKRREY